MVEGRPAPFAGDTIQVGALDAYEAWCRGCYEPGHDRLSLTVSDHRTGA